jgi:hypothetical protein
MKKLTVAFILMASVFLITACSESKPGKKVLVMASGDITVSENNVTLEEGTTHNEKEMNVTGDQITVKTAGGSVNIPVTAAGLYILNLKKDTIVGSYQRVGTDNSQEVISLENLQKRIDSLNQLMKGTNVSEANRNFCIAPQQAVKISDNTNAQVIGPYLRMPGSFEPGKEHEIYKFYTNKEMQEIVDKLKPMVETKKAEE